MLWRAVLSLERVEGLRDIKSIFVYQALSENTAATTFKIRVVVWEEVDENILREEIKRGRDMPGSRFGFNANASVESKRD